MFTARAKSALFLFTYLVAAPCALAQEATLESVVAQLARKIEQRSAAGSKTVLVMPFELSREIHSGLERRATDYRMLDPGPAEKLSLEEYWDPRWHKDARLAVWAGQKFAADYVVVGQASEKRDHVELKLWLLRTAPERNIAELTAKLPKDHDTLSAMKDYESRFSSRTKEVTDSRENPDSEGIYQAGKDGVSVPRCIYCPNPPFTDWAVMERFSGTIVLRVVVDTDGRIPRITPVKGAPFHMTAQAMNTVRTWKLEPAKKAGVVVPVRMLVEVVFRQSSQ